jgi:hypothetical protein
MTAVQPIAIIKILSRQPLAYNKPSILNYTDIYGSEKTL